MGFMDKIKDMVSSNTDKAKQGIDKAGDMIDDKTGGKFADKIDMAQEKAAGMVDDQANGQTEAPAADEA